MKVEHATRCPDCHRVIGQVSTSKPARRYCWQRGGTVCLQAQLLYERALVAPLLGVLERARAAIVCPLPIDGPLHVALVNLADSVVKLDQVEAPRAAE